MPGVLQDIPYCVSAAWTSVFIVWTDRKKGTLNAHLGSDVRVACPTLLVLPSIPLYKHFWCRNKCICVVVRTTVHKSMVMTAGSFLWSLSSEEVSLQLVLFSLSLDVTAYTVCYCGRVMGAPRAGERGKTYSGSLPSDPTWKVSGLWSSLRHSHHLV